MNLMEIWYGQCVAQYWIQMRRVLDLDDFHDATTINVSGGAEGAHNSYASMTDQFRMKNIEIQTIIRNSNKEDFELQVDPHSIAIEIRKDQLAASPPPKQHPRRENAGEEGEPNEQEEDGNAESEQVLKKLTKFLRKTLPLIESQMSESMPIYQRYGKDDESIFFKRESRLTVTLENLDFASEQNLQISDVSWNATGVIVAASYSKPDHEGTCSHKGMICLWALFKRNFKATRPQVINTPNCINCLTFHPKKPSMIVCGSYTGEILLYDFNRPEEQLIAKTQIDDYFHRDLITQLSWWPFRPPGKPDTNYNILSLGTDGKILLWQLPAQSIAEDAPPQRVRALLKYPIKGFLMLRKKEGAVIPVSGLAINQSKINKNVFIIGSQGGSILRATLNPVNHYFNNQSKVLLDLQQGVKFKNVVYPFLLNILPKNLPQVKSHVEKYCAKNKIGQIDSLATVFQSQPDIIKVYPNPITYAYEPLAFPISSISDNKYGLFIANAYDGYSRIYLENSRNNLESIQEGWQWGWIGGTHMMGGFIGQDWSVVDWTTGNVAWSIGVGQGRVWRQSGRQIAIVCDKTKVKVVELGDKLVSESVEKHQEVIKKIEGLKVE